MSTLSVLRNVTSEFFSASSSFFMLGWGSSLLFWRTQCQGRPEKKFSQFSWSWRLLHSWRVSHEKLTLWNYVIPNIFRRLGWDPINELVNEVLVRITIYWGYFLSCWQRNKIQKNEWLIMIKLHQSKNIFRASNHKIIFSDLVIFLKSFRSNSYEAVSQWKWLAFILSVSYFFTSSLFWCSLNRCFLD